MKNMELDTINKLYLELSQVATAKTSRERELEQEIERLKAGEHPMAVPRYDGLVSKIMYNVYYGSVSPVPPCISPNQARSAALAVAEWLSDNPDLASSGPFVANHIRAELNQ